MVQRRPARAEAVMTRRKPTRWKSTSPATSSMSPMEMTHTTPARSQEGLYKRGERDGCRSGALPVHGKGDQQHVIDIGHGTGGCSTPSPA